MIDPKKEKRKRVKKSYVLDTSAVVSYFADEDGASKVAQILETSLRGKVKVFLSFMTLMELEYNYLKKSGKELAKEVLLRLETLPLEISFENSSFFIHHAPKIKAESTLSVADAWIAALALERKAILVHKDSEFESISKIVTLLSLPYKK